MQAQLGIVLVLVASFIWGSYRGILKYTAEGLKVLPFMFIQNFIQIFTTLLIVLPQLSNIQRDFTPNKFFCFFFAGVFTQLSDFLYLSSTRHLTPVASRFFFGIFADVFVAIIIQSFIPNHDLVSMNYLICSAILYGFGLLSLTWGEYDYSKLSVDEKDADRIITIKKKKKKKEMKKKKVPIPKAENLDVIALEAIEKGHHNSHLYEHYVIDPEDENSKDHMNMEEGKRLGDNHDNNNDDDNDDEEEDNESSQSSSEIDFGVTFKDYDHIESEQIGFGAPNPIFDRPIPDAMKIQLSPPQVSILMINIDEVFSKTLGIAIALISGISLGMFFILSALGLNGYGKITDWSTAYLFCQLGKITSMPIFIHFFGYWDPWNIFPSDEKLRNISDLFDFNPSKFMVTMITGIILSGSYALIYFSAITVPFAIIDGLMTYETMIGYVMLYFIWGQFGPITFPLIKLNSPFQVKLWIGFILCTAAMLVMALKAYTF